MSNNIPIEVGELITADTINSWARGYFRKTTSKTVAGTTTATDLLNGEFTLPAGALSTDKILRLTAWGDWKQNSGAARDIPGFIINLGGGTDLIDTNSIGSNVAANAATRYGWRIVSEIQNLGSDSSQRCNFSGNIDFLAAGVEDAVAFTIGDGITMALNPGASAMGYASYDGGRTTSADTSAACALTLEVYNANNSANYETKLYGALVEII